MGERSISSAFVWVALVLGCRSAEPQGVGAPSFPPMTAVGPASGRTNAVVVLLHGYGADGADLRSLAESLARPLQDVVFLLPDGFESTPGGGSGRQWFALSDDASQRRARIRPAASRLTLWIDQELRRRGVSRARTVVGGFSQGAMLAIDLGLHMTPPPAGAFALSGRLVDDANPTDHPPPMLLVHGTSDVRIPFAEAERSADRLRVLHVATNLVSLRGVGHTITGDGVEATTAFIQDVLR